MKLTHIIGLLVIAAAITIIISVSGDASAYVTFKEAKDMNGKVHVVGTLAKDASGSVVGIKPGADLVTFEFQMVDNDGVQQRVFYNEPMPPDFQRSEQVVVVGSYRSQDLFVADQILLKCPSKYEDEVSVKEINATKEIKQIDL